MKINIQKHIALAFLIACSSSWAADQNQFSEGLADIFVDGYTGFVNTSGELVIEPVFLYASPFSEGLAVAHDEEYEGYIDKKGKWVIKANRVNQDVTRYGYNFHEGLAPARDLSTGKMGVIDKTSKWVVKPIYDVIGPFQEGLAVVGSNEKRGFIDRTGELVVPLLFDMAHDFSEGLAPVKIVGAWGYADKTGSLIIPPVYEQAGSFSNGLASIRLNGKHGYINKNNEIIYRAQFKFAKDFSEGLAKVSIDGNTFGFIGATEGNWTINPISVLNFGDFHEGRALLVQNRPFAIGFIDKTGKVVIPINYDRAEDFSEGLAFVSLNKKNGYIDRDGNVAILFGFSEKWEEIAKKRADIRRSNFTAKFRKSVAEGDYSNCGKVLEVKVHSVKVYYPLEGYGNEHWIDRNKIFPFGFGCRFENGKNVSY